MTPRYVKKILELSQRENPRKKCFMKPTGHPSKEKMVAISGSFLNLGLKNFRYFQMLGEIIKKAFPPTNLTTPRSLFRFH